jgi:perosamine synthetase
MVKKFIPISMPSITQLEIDYVNDAVKSTWISSIGKYIDEFESKFAEFCGTKYGIAVSNGTVAIHLALIANKVGPGDEVIVPNLSFIATANAVLHAGATPVFADIDPFNLCISPDSVEKLITDKTKAIMPVHLYGHPADMRQINEIAKKHNIIVIEDAAEAHGAKIEGKRIGGWSTCATFSFYGNKNMTTGEGGMIVTDNEELYHLCRYLRDHAMSKEKRYWHTMVGYNYRMTNIQAALGCAQLERAEGFMQKRAEIFHWYHNRLKGIEGLSLNRTNEWADNSYWLICLEHDLFNEVRRDDFSKKLKTYGVDSRPYFYPMSDMPYINNENVNTPITHSMYQKGLNLPTYTDLTKEDVNIVCDSVLKVLEEKI